MFLSKLLGYLSFVGKRMSHALVFKNFLKVLFWSKSERESLFSKSFLNRVLEKGSLKSFYFLFVD